MSMPEKPHVEGTQCFIPADEGTYLFTVTKRRYWRTEDDRTVINYACIGGRMEDGETALDSIKREAMEESGCEIDIYHAHRTYLIDLSENVETKTLDYEPAEAAIYTKDFPGKPGNPDAEGEWRLTSHVYVGTLRGKPKPLQEVPAFLYLTEEQVKRTLETRTSLGELLEDGAKIIENEHIPRNAIMLPVRASDVLGRLLGGKFNILLKNTTYTRK